MVIFIGHYNKILDVGYWWPALQKGILEYYKACDRCHRVGNMTNNGLAELVTMMPVVPFMKLGLNFIGPIKCIADRTGKRNILWLQIMPPSW